MAHGPLVTIFQKTPFLMVNLRFIYEVLGLVKLKWHGLAFVHSIRVVLLIETLVTQLTQTIFFSIESI